MTNPRSAGSWGVDPDSLARPNRSFSGAPPGPTGTRETDGSPATKSPRGKRGYAIWLVLCCVGLTICLACACAAAILVFVVPQILPQATLVPEITVQEPLGDTQVQVGQPVPIRASATDREGVTRVQLWVDDILNAEITSDEPGGQKTLLLQHTWVPATGGTHNIALRAYNVSGQASEPAYITASVKEPEPPTSTPQPAPTATPTPAQQAMAATTAAPTNTPVPSPTPTVLDCTDDAAFVADVTVPDNTVFQPGAPIDKTWRIRNSGTCPWGASYSLAFVSGNQMGGTDSQPVSATEPGGTTDVTVTMQAPSSYGTHTGVWKMVDAAGEPFGGQFTVVIQVPSPHTPTPEPTATPVPQAGPAINISVDRDQLNTGECTILHASVEGVTAAWLAGEPVAGGSLDKEVCPCGDTIYVLEAELPGGERVTKEVTVHMPGGCDKSDLVIRDLEVKDGDTDIEKGDKITIRLRIKNQGSAEAKNVVTSWWPFGEHGEERLDFTTDSLDPGEDRDFYWEDIIYDRTGEFSTLAIVDYTNKADESNEDNNSLRLEIEVD